MQNVTKLRKKRIFGFVRQSHRMDCGPTCLAMIAKYYGKNYSLDSLGILREVSKSRTSLLELSKAAEAIGIKSQAVRISYSYLESKAILPCIVYLNNSHFVIIYKIKKDMIYVADPALGLIRYSKKEFLKDWANNVGREEQGICLLTSKQNNYFKRRDGQEFESAI